MRKEKVKKEVKEEWEKKGIIETREGEDGEEKE